MKIIKITRLHSEGVLYINSNYIVNFFSSHGQNQINVMVNGQLTTYFIIETPEQLMDALRE